MGCCCCCSSRQVSDITEDPTIPYVATRSYTRIHTRNGFVLKRVRTNDPSGNCPVLVYLQDGYLVSENTCSGKFCCSCCTFRLPLSEITQVQKANYNIIGPGLKITCNRGDGSELLILFSIQSESEQPQQNKRLSDQLMLQVAPR